MIKLSTLVKCFSKLTKSILTTKTIAKRCAISSTEAYSLQESLQIKQRKLKSFGLGLSSGTLMWLFGGTCQIQIPKKVWQGTKRQKLGRNQKNHTSFFIQSLARRILVHWNYVDLRCEYQQRSIREKFLTIEPDSINWWPCPRIFDFQVWSGSDCQDAEDSQYSKSSMTIRWNTPLHDSLYGSRNCLAEDSLFSRRKHCAQAENFWQDKFNNQWRVHWKSQKTKFGKEKFSSHHFSFVRNFTVII